MRWSEVLPMLLKPVGLALGGWLGWQYFALPGAVGGAAIGFFLLPLLGAGLVALLGGGR